MNKGKKMNKRIKGTGGYRTKSGDYIPFKTYEQAGMEKRAKRIVQVEGDTSKEFNSKMLQAFAKHTLRNS